MRLQRVIPLEQYLDYRLKQAIIRTWAEQSAHARARADITAEPSGLIPDIELPRLPVFGEGSRIDIAGRDRITLGGSQTRQLGRTVTLGAQRLLPELKLEQELAVSLNGTIGERTKVTIDHDSQRQEGQNKVKLSYTGNEDEVVQSVELGDTRLDIPRTGYTGDLPTHQGLFGVSAKGKLGAVDLYAVASREESQSQTQSFTGQRRVTVDTLYDTDYEQQRFYRIPVGLQVTGVRVYVDDRNPGNNQSAIKAIATVFPEDPAWVPDTARGQWTWDRAGGDFDLKSLNSDFVVHPGNVIEFTPPLTSREVVGLVIQTDSGAVGGSTWNDSLVLKLLKPERPDSLSLTWEYELRNTYSLGRTDIKLHSLRILRKDMSGVNYIDYEDNPASPVYGRKFVDILGLDADGDGIIEYPFFDAKPGLVRFPQHAPFALSALSVRDSCIYRRDPDELREGEGRKYRLAVEYSSATESYYLGQTDITQNSERVTVNGQLWLRGTDYSIDYRTGVLTFIRTLPPNADIKVTYEYRPLFMFAERSLVGTRAEWTFAQNGKVGTSVFYRNEASREEDPTLGNEPFRRTIAESDVSYAIRSDDVTAFLDRLPVVRAEGPASISVSAEGAISLPDPNTRGVAYVDDFEQTVISRELPTTALLWSHASVPAGKDTLSFCRTPLRWETPEQKVRKDSVFGIGIGDEGRETQDVLRVCFTPDPGGLESWAGIMNAPSGSQLGMNFTEIENLQFVLRTRGRSGSIHVDLAMSLDEDAPRRTADGRIAGYNGFLDTEDRNMNGLLDGPDEDTGLDTIASADSLHSPDSHDDGNDDYDPRENQSGTEGNRRLDSEDIDRNGFSRYNHYFQITIPLGDTRFTTDLANGWRRYRIPLRDTFLVGKVGNPRWEDIRVVRLWLDGFSLPDTIEFFSMEFVGSKWRAPRIQSTRDSISPPVDTMERVVVGQISRKTDTAYVPPFEPRRDIYGQTRTEASLEFSYFHLHPYRRAYVDRAYITAEDFRDYRSLRVYVHDDTNHLTFLLRIGGDSANWYEFSAPINEGVLVPGRDSKWFEFVIPLDSFPILKLQRDSACAGVPLALQLGGYWSRGRYSVQGNPSLAEVRYMALGIVNYGPGRHISGSVWFDDIRLTGPRRDPGYGLQARVGLGLSGIATLNLNLNYSDPNFRSFSEARGVKTGGFGSGFGVSGSVNLDRFLPSNLGLLVPVSWSRTTQQTFPKYSASYPDLRVRSDQAGVEKGSVVSQDISVDNLRKQRSSNRFLNYTIESMSLSWRRRGASSLFPLRRDAVHSTAWRWGYSVNPEVKVRLGSDKDLYLLPRSLRVGISDAANRTVTSSRSRPSDSLRTDTTSSHRLNADLATELSPIEDLNIEYSLETERDRLVRRPETILFIPAGTEVSQSQNVGVSYELEIGEFVNPSIELDAQYDHDRPRLETGYAPYRNIGNSGEISLGADFELPEILQALAGVNRDRRLSGGHESAGVTPQLRHLFSSIGSALEPLDCSWSISRSSEYAGVSRIAPLGYRLGVVDTFPFEIAGPFAARNREQSSNLRLSGGARYRDFSVRTGYDRTRAREAGIVGATADYSTVWPSIDVGLGRVHMLFSRLATDSRLSSTYRLRTTVTGELLPCSLTTGWRETLGVVGRVLTRSAEFSPLLSWSTTWKKRINTTLSGNYSRANAISYLSEDGQARMQRTTTTRGASIQLSYAFSAPHGIMFLFLRRLRFSSDLSLTWNLRYSNTTRGTQAWERGRYRETPEQDDDAVSTSLAASYRFSRSIEAGLNTGFSNSRNKRTRTGSQRTDVDFWILFRF
ncbi:MAG: hypothetical protein ABIK43_00130 [candidate division WOR-3 bacterium]